MSKLDLIREKIINTSKDEKLVRALVVGDGKWTCQLCNKLEDERAIQEQCGYSLCLSCDGKYTDEELCEEMEGEES